MDSFEDSFEENRRQDISIDDVFDGIHLFFPDIKEEDIQFLYHGTYNVFEVKGLYIFRFPDKVFRNYSGVKLIQNEIKILDLIRNFISISISEPEFISVDPENPFMGYKKIEGVSLSRCFQKVSVDNRLKIAGEIGRFLSDLHSNGLLKEVVSKRIIETQFSPNIYREYWKNYFKMVQTIIFPFFSISEKELITHLFLNFLENDMNFQFTPVLVHGDFDISNIIINPKTFELSGIIDFEDSRIYDPAADLLFFDEGSTFFQQIILNYKQKIDIGFEQRRNFLYGRTCLAYIEFGLKNKRDDMINWGLKKLKRIMNEKIIE